MNYIIVGRNEGWNYWDKSCLVYCGGWDGAWPGVWARRGPSFFLDFWIWMGWAAPTFFLFLWSGWTGPSFYANRKSGWVKKCFLAQIYPSFPEVLQIGRVKKCLTGPSKYKFLKIRWAGAARYRWAGAARFRWAGAARFKWSAPPQPNYHKKAPRQPPKSRKPTGSLQSPY